MAILTLAMFRKSAQAPMPSSIWARQARLVTFLHHFTTALVVLLSQMAILKFTNGRIPAPGQIPAKDLKDFRFDIPRLTACQIPVPTMISIGLGIIAAFLAKVC